VLADKLTRYFDSAVRTRGRSYFASGRVRILSRSPHGGVEAQVRGTRLYQVHLELDRTGGGLTVGAACTCPYDDGLNGFCKHIWATLLEVDREGGFGPLPRTVRMEFLDDDDDEPLGWDDDEDTGDMFHPLTVLLKKGMSGLLGRERTRKQKKQVTPAWSRLLADLAAQSASPPSASRLDATAIEPLYVLEPEDKYAPGRFTLSLARQTSTATGRLGKPKRLSLRPADIPRLASRLDRHICLMLVGAGQENDGYYSACSEEYAPAQSKWIIPPGALATLLPMLFETGRFCMRPDQGDLLPLSWDDGESWEFVLAVEPEAGKRHYLLNARLHRGDQTAVLNATDRFLKADPPLMIRGGVMSQVRAPDCFRWLTTFSRQGGQRIEPSHRDRLLSEVGQLDVCPPIRWPAEWGITQVTDVAPRPELSLTLGKPTRTGRNGDAFASVAFYYGDLKVEPGRPGQILMDVKHRRQLFRQLDAETACWSRLMALGFQCDPYGGELRLADRRLLPAVSALMREGWTVLGDRKLFRNGGDLSLDVTTGIDWFEIHGQMDFEGQTVPLPELLAAARKGERFIRLGDGSMGLLPEKWLAQHGALLDLGRVEDGQVRFARTQVGLIDALLAQLPQATFDDRLTAARDKLRGFAGIQPRPAPAGFTGRLRPYQEQGLAWLDFLNDLGWGGCLADDMGLGKTIQVLALLLDRKRRGDSGPSLIVVPKSIVFNWQREATAFAPELRVLDYTGHDRLEHQAEIAGSDLVLTTYGTFKRDIDFLRTQEFNYAILDEAQAIKNSGSLNAKAARLLRARHRLAMTGTPVENHLGDLWSLFEFLNPGMLGSLKGFRSAFNGQRGAEASPANLELLHRMLRPFILRRTKDQVAPELPTRSEQTLECVMSPEQAAYYKELRDYYRLSLLGRVEKHGIARSKVFVLEALLRLRQAACHPALIDPGRHAAESAKMDALLPMLEELLEEGHKALVFSQFTSLLALLREKLDGQGVVYEYLDGQTRDRQARVDRFQSDPRCPLFLISLKAGGTGLNLTAADYVFILDPWWNPAVEAQAIDRTHRIGQDRKVIAYRLITCETVEARILELQQRKRDLAGAIITEANSLIQDLTREDLEVLLS